jgi:hypothetical protein
MGTKLDARRRENERVDDDDRKKKVEMTRSWIFERGYGVLSKAVQRILSPMSLVPTRVCSIQVCIASHTNFQQNAFSERLSKFGFNFYSVFVVDLLHEFELGVWKAVFTHLMRLLYAVGGDCIQMLNKRCLSPFLMVYVINTDAQVPSNPNFRWTHNTSLQSECIRNEEIGR